MNKFLKFLVLAFALALPLTAGAWAPDQLGVSDSDKDKQHKAFHWIVMQNDVVSSLSRFNIAEAEIIDSAAGCTAYAIAPHVLLTAQHCDLPDARLLIDSIGNPHDGQTMSKSVEIVEKVYDKHDHMLLVVPSVTFKDIVKYEPKKYRPAVQGEQVYFWGNPDWLHNMYREGYTMGITMGPEDSDLVPAGTVMYVFDLNGNHGDSGSAIFSARDGRIVSIVTYGLQDSKFIGGFLLSFTKEQVKEAEGRK